MVFGNYSVEGLPLIRIDVFWYQSMNETVIEFQGRPILVSSNSPTEDEFEEVGETDEILEEELLIDLSEEYLDYHF